MKRKIIHIDERLCNGCGQCIPNCPEGALQLIDGKARLVSDLFCDGLGACIGECPLGAIRIEEREAEPYDERRVMENVIAQGEGVIRAHLVHLKEHGEGQYLEQALSVLEDKGLHEIAATERVVSSGSRRAGCGAGGCPGARVEELSGEMLREEGVTAPERLPAELRQWPVQLHLLPSSAPYLRDADVLLAADCSAYAHGDFHREFLRGKRLAIACPKLDGSQDIYLDKLKAMIDFSAIRSLTVLTMEVPCCRGLLQLARQAAAETERTIPIEWIEIGIQGEVLGSERFQ